MFGLNYSDEAEQIDKTIKAVQDFFEAMTVKTRLADYDLDEQAIEAVVANLEKSEITKLGEHGDIDLEKVKSILALAL